MTLLSSKKTHFEKTTSSDNKLSLGLFCGKKNARKKFGIFDQNHLLTSLEKCKFFDDSNVKGVGLHIKDSLKYKTYLMKPSSHFGSKSKRLYEAKN